MILYIRCSCKTKDRLLINEYRALGYEIRNITNNVEWRKEVKQYSARLPFTVVDGVVTEL